MAHKHFGTNFEGQLLSIKIKR